MFCPRCGRPVNPTANFCGGCGLPRTEIEKIVQAQVQPVQPEVQMSEIDVEELNNTISQLESDLTGAGPVENYTTDDMVITNTDSADDIVQEIKLTVEEQYTEKEEKLYAGQSEYSRNAPQHPYYTQAEKVGPQMVQQVSQPAVEQNQNLTTVDFVWMLLIALIPVVGMFYVIYQAFVQNENVNKKSWARATLIVYVFAFLLVLVFSMGLMLTQFLYW